MIVFDRCLSGVQDMELTILDYVGLPDGSILSVRSGPTRRQSPLPCSAPFRPVFDEQEPFNLSNLSNMWKQAWKIMKAKSQMHFRAQVASGTVAPADWRPWPSGVDLACADREPCWEGWCYLWILVDRNLMTKCEKLLHYIAIRLYRLYIYTDRDDQFFCSNCFDIDASGRPITMQSSEIFWKTAWSSDASDIRKWMCMDFSFSVQNISSISGFCMMPLDLNW